MAPQNKLVKAGMEGFALLDEFYCRNKRSAGSKVPTTIQAYDHYHSQYYSYNNQQQYVYQGPRVIIVREPLMDSNQAAQFYGGVSIVDHRMRKPIRGVYN